MVETYDLPTPPILQKEAFLAQKKGVYDLPFLAPRKTNVDHRIWPPGWFKPMIYLALF